jgi:hypothetical protein
MARTIKSDLPSLSLPIGNGSSVLTPSFPLLDLGKYSRTSDFTINPPSVRIDVEIKKLIEFESKRLRLKPFNYNGDEAAWDLQKIMDSNDGKDNEAKNKLMRDGKSAIVSEVSKAINASSIDHSSKYLLSHEPFYVYALSYAIYNEKVSDAEGINDRILGVVENKIKPYLNKVLAAKIIKDKHLDLTESQKEKIMQAVTSTNISLLQGQPVKSITKIISKYVDYGTLNSLVDRFFEEGPIDAEKGTPQIRQLMVKYLVDIGLTVSPDDLNSDLAGQEKSGSLENKKVK